MGVTASSRGPGSPLTGGASGQLMVASTCVAASAPHVTWIVSPGCAVIVTSQVPPADSVVSSQGIWGVHVMASQVTGPEPFHACGSVPSELVSRTPVSVAVESCVARLAASAL